LLFFYKIIIDKKVENAYYILLGKAMAEKDNFFINKYKINSSKNLDNKINSNKDFNKDQEKKIFFEKIPEDNKQKNDIIPKKKLAALLLILSGIDKAVKIIKNFSKEEIIKAVSEIIKIEKITPEELDAVERNFGKLNIKDLSQYKGGKDFAINLLQKALGMTEGSALFIKCIEENEDKNLSFLENLKPEEIYNFISEESTSVVAIILGLLDPKISSKVLMLFPKEKIPDIIKKLSSKLEINSDALDIIILKLKKEVEEYKKDKTNTINISGKKKLIEILKLADPEKSKSIIEELAKEDPSLATELEEKIFTFEDIIFIKNEDLEKVLKKYSDDKEIAFILKGASDDIKNKFLTCISKRRKDIIEKEIDYLGKVRKEEVLEKRKKFIEYLKEMEKNGEILLRPDKEIYIT